MPVKSLREYDYDDLIAEAHVYLREQPRSPDGRFAEGDGDDEGGDYDRDTGGDLPGGRPGTYGYGVDPKGKSYTEDDVDEENGQPRFSEEYREQYGPVESDNGMGPNSDYAVAWTESGSFQIADDTRGTENREVLQDFKGKPDDFEKVAVGIDDASRGPGVFLMNNRTERISEATGVKVEPILDQPEGQPPTGDVRVTWTSGKTTVFDRDTAADLGDASTWAPDAYRGDMRSRSAHGLAVLHPDELVRTIAAKFLAGLPELKEYTHGQD